MFYFFGEVPEFHNRLGSGTILAVMTKPIARSHFEKLAPLSRLDTVLAVGLGLFALALYVRTLAPGLLDGDAGEFQFAAWGFGLAHPTGYPLYLLLGGAWQHGLARFGADPAWALNLFSAVTAALTVALLFMTMRKIVSGPARVSRGVALFSAALFAVNPTFWSQALMAEVYALHGLLMVLILLAALGWDGSMRRTVMVAGLVGLGLAHHRTTVFVIPGVLLAVWLIHTGAGQPAGSRTRLARGGRLWIGAGLAVSLPQLLYLYIPLRGTAEASPWYFPRLGESVIPLYVNSWRGFLDYLTGSVFAVSFFGPGQALARLPEAGALWLDHFTWVGLGLIGVGLIGLVQDRRWTLLALTLPLGAMLQLFNLFYGIGDIYVYYIPLYLIGAIYAGLGVEGVWRVAVSVFGGMGIKGKDNRMAPRALQHAILLFLLIPATLSLHFFSKIDQSANHGAGQMWAEILAARPPDGAILVSNDRNEIVPLYYLQNVEGVRPDLTGIFPLLTPEERFGDVGATVATALAEGAGRPVALIKPMPGLESRFALAPLTPPLAAVTGSAAVLPEDPMDLAYGPLTLLGVEWAKTDGGATVALTWRVDAPVPGDFTTTVQLFDAAGERLAQDDRRPGGVFYPTGLWKVGEALVDAHALAWDGGEVPARLLVGMYTGADFAPLAPFLEIQVP